ncbi:hypothetical protein DSTSK_27630 [Desulforhabdus sp. TSK]|nr:hypothetical protein DSTSK_27630 [Desulforhabdus sp. TSK]
MENLKPFVGGLSNLPVPEPDGLDLIIAMGCEKPEDSQTPHHPLSANL